MVAEEERFSVVWPMSTSIARPLLFNFSRRIFWADQFMPAGAFWGHPHFDVSWTSLHGMFLFLMEDFGTIPHCSGKSTVSSSNFQDPESIASGFRGVSFLLVSFRRSPIHPGEVGTFPLGQHFILITLPFQ